MDEEEVSGELVYHIIVHLDDGFYVGVPRAGAAIKIFNFVHPKLFVVKQMCLWYNCRPNYLLETGIWTAFVKRRQSNGKSTKGCIPPVLCLQPAPDLPAQTEISEFNTG